MALSGLQGIKEGETAPWGRCRRSSLMAMLVQRITRASFTSCWNSCAAPWSKSRPLPHSTSILHAFPVDMLAFSCSTCLLDDLELKMQ